MSRPHPTVWRILLVGLIVAVMVGFYVQHAASQEQCRQILTLNRNLFSPLPTDPRYPEASAYVHDVLAPLYRRQYRMMNREFHLDEQCGEDLPKGTPPPPVR